MKYISYIALLGSSFVNASATADESFDNTLASCRSFASKFANTCTDQTTSQAFASIATETMTCDMGTMGTCPTHGTLTGTSCSFTRKLCVSCFEENSVVRVRAQSNGMPSHCFANKGTAAEEVEYDFTVDWLSAPSTTTTTDP